MTDNMIEAFALASILVMVANTARAGDYVEVNGLKTYYEKHGTGKPLVLLHGAFGTAAGWSHVLPTMLKGRQVILIEQQGHGHTSDREGPLSYEQMADDTAALLRALSVRSADVFGYSDGGVVGLGLAIKHPELVGKLAILGANAGTMESTYDDASYEQFLSLPADFAPRELKEPYDRVAPDKSNWPVLVRKIKDLGRNFRGFADNELRAIRARVLVMQGDRDAIKPEHAVAMMRLIPNSQLAIIPDADHFILYTQPARVTEILIRFFGGSA
jgi:pimeloyl-ACP methyl ester carboxylesterase